MTQKVIIMGAAGRDFHNFNLLYKDNPAYRVIAFTAAQIPLVHDRLYPPELAGPLYPQGIPFYPEEELSRPDSGAPGRSGGIFLQRRGPRGGDAPEPLW